jgi:hypothetical protein
MRATSPPRLRWTLGAGLRELIFTGYESLVELPSTRVSLYLVGMASDVILVSIKSQSRFS